MNTQKLCAINDFTKLKIKRYRKWRNSLGVLLLSGGVFLSMSSNVAADCTVFKLDHCFAAERSDGDASVGIDLEWLTDIGNDIETAANDVGNQLEAWANDIEDYINDLGDAMLRALANAAFDQVADPMISLADDWATLIADDSTTFNRLADAITEMDAVELSLALDDVLMSLFLNTSFQATVEKFKEEGVGSILFIAGAGGGAIVTAEVDVGIAIDIDYIIHRAEGKSASSYGGSVASLFGAVGVQAGTSVGGGVDAIVGYHMSPPTGVGGPGIDITLGAKSGIGGSVSIGMDASTTDLPVVTGSIGLGAGVEIELDIGASYVGILAHLCSDGSIELLTTDCSSTDNTDSMVFYYGEIPDCGVLNASERLYPGEVLESCNGEYHLSHQYDGNVVIYNSGTATWSTQTAGESTSGLTMQGDGNLVLYGDGALWASKTSSLFNATGEFLYLSNTGELIIYNNYSATVDSKIGTITLSSNVKIWSNY